MLLWLCQCPKIQPQRIRRIRTVRSNLVFKITRSLNPIRAEKRPHRRTDPVVERGTVLKTHFFFGGVNVKVHERGIHFYKQCGNGVRAVGKKSLATVFNRLQ